MDFDGVGTWVALKGVDANALHGSQIAESYGSPPKPFDILPSGLIPPPSPKGPLGVPLGHLPSCMHRESLFSVVKKAVGITRNGSTKLLYHD